MKETELRQKMGDTVAKMRQLLDSAKDGVLTAEQESSYDAMNTEVNDLKKQIERIVAQEKLEKSNLEAQNQAQANANKAGASALGASDEEKAKAAAALHHDAFFAEGGYLRAKNGHMRQEFVNALEAGTDAEGGYLVPEEWEAGIIKEIAEINVIRRYARSMSTSLDKNFPVRTSRGTFTWIDEEGAYSTNDPAYGNVKIAAFKVGGIIQVSDELLADNAYNLASELTQDAAEEFADQEEDAFLNGTGSKPTGLFQASSVAGVSITGTTAASASVVTADELIDTYHGLGRKYRRNAVWVRSDAMAKQIRKLKDSDNQYLWQPGLRQGEPDALLGRPFETSDSAPAIATGVKTILFSDLSYYRICDRLGTEVKRLDDLYAANGQVGFRFTRRVDAKPTLAGAVTFLDMA